MFALVAMLVAAEGPGGTLGKVSDTSDSLQEVAKADSDVRSKLHLFVVQDIGSSSDEE